MFSREVKYKDFNGLDQTETFYFNLSKTELIEMEVQYENGLSKAIETLMASQNNAEILAIFKKMILDAYGVKSDDGKRFIKSPELSREFSQHAAYEVLFMELASNADAAAAFINGLIPADLAEAVEKEMTAQKFVKATTGDKSTAELAAELAQQD